MVKIQDYPGQISAGKTAVNSTIRGWKDDQTVPIYVFLINYNQKFGRFFIIINW